MTNFFTAIAKMYLMYNLCTLPASKEKKRPMVAWKAYQDTMPTESEWDEWGKTATAICIITGKASGFLVVIDFDDKGSRFHPWCQQLPEELLERLVIVQTPSGGYHVYVRCEGETVGNVKLARTAEEKTLIETRGEGGQVIAPPTSGYEITSGKLENIPVVSPAEWELLRNAAQSFDEMPTKAKPKAGNTTSVEIPVDMTMAVQRAVVHINGMPEAIAGQNGHKAALRVANALHDFGLDFDTAKEVFMTFYNPRCVPEWSEKEVDHKLDTAYSKPLREAGCMLAGPDFELHPKMPLISADKFIETVYTVDGIPTLIYYADDFWQWDGNVYRKIEERKVKSKLTRFLEWVGAFPVTPARLNAIAEMLKNRVFHSTSDTIPCWIGSESCEMPSSVTNPSLLIFGKSKILNLTDIGTDVAEIGTLPHSPHWLNFAALDFDYDPKAERPEECPKWMTFLDSVFGGDEDAKQTLMEWMGLCLTTITKFQKAMFLVGPKRSGKGTIARILQKIVGIHNTVSPSTSDFGERFGLQAFIGKTLAIISDARFTKHGTSRATERILNITGEDALTIDRKNKVPVTLRLQTKLTFISNEVPNVLDQSGALPSRFIFLALPKSFYGKEDVDLESKLSCELPGILRLSIRHLQDLLDRKEFIQPKSGKGLAERMMSLSSPASEFMKQLLPGMSREAIWNQWCNVRRDEGQKLGTKNELWNDLESAGYGSDFEKPDLVAKIQEHGGESTVRKLQDSISKYHEEGGAERLKQLLDEMVDAGILTDRYEKARNGKKVAYYRIPGEKLGDTYDKYC